jgi:hypothetical protein
MPANVEIAQHNLTAPSPAEPGYAVYHALGSANQTNSRGRTKVTVSCNHWAPVRPTTSTRPRCSWAERS